MARDIHIDVSKHLSQSLSCIDNIYKYKRQIDVHSHLGSDRFYKLKGDLHQYASLSKQIGITEAIMMPCPCPTYVENNNTHIPLIWTIENNDIVYDTMGN